jgi:tetratricopeptide (TPR) repeat protein
MGERPRVPNIVLRRIRETERQETRSEFADAMARKAEELGESISPSERYIARLEDGDVRYPHPAYRRVLTELCGRSSAELGFVSRKDQHGTVSGQDASESVTYRFDLARHEQLEVLRQQMNDALNEGMMAEASIDDWERTAVLYGRATRDRPAAVLLDDLGSDLADLNRILRRHRSASALRRLTRVAAQMSGLMCLTFCILDDRPAFRRWARTARLAADEAGDPETLSWILAQEAHGHYYSGNMLEAIEVARHACEVTRIPCVGMALAAALEARAQAALGRDQEAHKAIARADNILSQLGGEALIPSAFGYNEGSFRFHEGNAYTNLRDVKLAFGAQERALELCSQDDYNDWALTRLDRAHCLVYDHDITSGLAYASETMKSLTVPQRQGIIVLRGKEILGTLPKKEIRRAIVSDFRELLMLPTGESEVEP